MFRLLSRTALTFAAVIASSAAAQAACPSWHTLANGTTANANDVMDNFNYILCSPTFTDKVSFSNKVGIGTASPNGMLTVGAASGGTIDIFDTTAASDTSTTNGFRITATDGILTWRGVSSTGSTATVRAALNAAGNNFSIGTTTFSYGLTTSNSSGGTTLTNAGGAANGIINTSATDGSYSGLVFLTKDATGTVLEDAKIAGVHTSHTTSAVTAELAFLTRNAGTYSEKMRLTAAGKLGVLTNAPAYPLDVVGDIRTSTCLRYNSGSLGSCASDARVKRDTTSFIALGLAEIVQLKPVTFFYNGLGGNPDDGVKQIGLIAQDVERVAPQLVGTMTVKLHSADAKVSQIKTVNYGALTYGLINAVKELKAQNDKSKATIAALEQRLARLEERLAHQANQSHQAQRASTEPRTHRYKG